MARQRHTWIGLCGRARSGKDTAADHLVTHYGFTKVAFADPLREMALAIDPPVHDEYERLEYLSDVVGRNGWEFAKDKYPEVRRFLQRLGTEGVRSTFGDKVWVDLAHETASAIGGNVVFTDVRFPNEVEMVEYYGGKCVRVVRHSDDSASEHVSETALDGWEMYQIDNRGSLEDLPVAVDHLMFALGIQ